MQAFPDKSPPALRPSPDWRGTLNIVLASLGSFSRYAFLRPFSSKRQSRAVKAAKPSGKRQSRAAAAIRGAQLSWTTEEETDENTVTDDDQGTTTGGDAGGGNGGGGGNSGELEE